MYGHICLGIPKLSNATIFNDLERPLTQISRSSHHSTLNISNNHHKTETYNGILTGIYTRCTQGCHFEWPWVTRSIARPLCDSWDSCIALIPRHGGGWRKKVAWVKASTEKGEENMMELKRKWLFSILIFAWFWTFPVSALSALAIVNASILNLINVCMFLRCKFIFNYKKVLKAYMIYFNISLFLFSFLSVPVS